MPEILITDLPRECIEDCSAGGRAADPYVDAWVKDPAVAAVIARFSQSDMARGLREYGAWDAEELTDEAQNRARVLWLACGTFSEYIFEAEEAGIDPFGDRPDSFEPNCGSDLFSLD